MGNITSNNNNSNKTIPIYNSQWDSGRGENSQPYDKNAIKIWSPKIKDIPETDKWFYHCNLNYGERIKSFRILLEYVELSKKDELKELLQLQNPTEQQIKNFSTRRKQYTQDIEYYNNSINSLHKCILLKNGLLYYYINQEWINKYKAIEFAKCEKYIKHALGGDIKVNFDFDRPENDESVIYDTKTDIRYEKTNDDEYFIYVTNKPKNKEIR